MRCLRASNHRSEYLSGDNLKKNNKQQLYHGCSLFAPHRHIKSAKEYILDLSIIFVAIMLGFIVNDARESYVERSKEKEYARLLYNDLKTDMSAIQQTISNKEWIEAKYDSAENILATKDIREYNEFIYYVERYISNNSEFTPRDNTMQQSWHPGNYNASKSLRLHNEFAGYYQHYNQYKAIENSYESFNENNLNGIESILFNPRDLSSLDNMNATNFQSLVLRTVTPLKPIRRDIENLKLFYIKIHYAKKHANYTKLLLKEQMVYGLNIIKDLKKEFDLE